MNLEDDPILGEIIDTPEKKARILYYIKIAYLVWIIFLIVGILFLLYYYLFL